VSAGGKGVHHDCVRQRRSLTRCRPMRSGCRGWRSAQKKGVFSATIFADAAIKLERRSRRIVSVTKSRRRAVKREVGRGLRGAKRLSASACSQLIGQLTVARTRTPRLGCASQSSSLQIRPATTRRTLLLEPQRTARIQRYLRTKDVAKRPESCSCSAQSIPFVTLASGAGRPAHLARNPATSRTCASNTRSMR